MKETKVNKKVVQKGPDKYKAVNPTKFSAMFTEMSPFYNELCKGESVVLDLENNQVKSWLMNKIIVKES
tara:strand:+ start:392 stop:598 length:207 start_codon:yes stop_codon:yes gene_type:complete